jgi:kynureninase
MVDVRPLDPLALGTDDHPVRVDRAGRPVGRALFEVERAVRKPVPGAVGEGPREAGEAVSVRCFDDERAAGPKHPPELSEHADVLVALEVAERREQIGDGVEARVPERKLAVVAAHQSGPLGIAASRLRLGKECGGPIEPGDAVALLGKRDRVSSEAGRAVEDLGAGLDSGEVDGAPRASARVRSGSTDGRYVCRYVSSKTPSQSSISGRLRLMRDLLDYRSEFPILEHTTYLASHTLGPMPRQVPQRLAEFARMWAERGIRSWAEGWWAMPTTVGDQIGRIVGAPAGSTVMHQNVAIAEAIALSCFRPVDPARNRVVYERGNFPSVRYLYQAQPDLEVVVCEDDAEIVERIDERTLLVPISHVLYKDSEIQDVLPIMERAHEVGAHVILDCYQSAGIVPVDVTALGVDFAVGGSVKWLCGGPGNGWLYVRPDLAERLEPTYTGWQAHDRPFAFAETMEYANGAARFLTGTPNPAAHFAGTAGYELIEEIGVERIRENSLRQTELLIELADAAGFAVYSTRDPVRRGGAVIISVPEAAAVYAELEERGVLGDFRPGAGIRVGPHFFTTDGELQLVITQIAEIVESGAYARHAGAAALH